MTITDVSLEFEEAAALRRAVKATAVDAKLDATKTPEPAVFKQMLNLLVGLGLLNAEQARALWEAVTGGTLIPLPPIPFPDAATPGPGLYDIIRAKLNRPAGAAGAAGAVDVGIDGTGLQDVSFVSDVTLISQAVIAVVNAAEAVGGAISDAWHWLFG